VLLQADAKYGARLLLDGPTISIADTIIGSTSILDKLHTTNLLFCATGRMIILF
jgi:hypothetical protein